MTKQRLELTWYNKDMALIPAKNGKYGYTWVHPSDPRYCETHTLVMEEYVRGTQTPKSEEFAYSARADLEPQDDNLLILGESGDVLEALTRVPELADKYMGQAKLVYIDPPFNTAQTFPSYEDNLEHSIWLTMMRDRLLHLKKLLRDDGSIWVHLDDVEVHRMRLLLDEVFGPGNFVAEVVWEKSYGGKNDSANFVTNTDLILVYAKDSKNVVLNRLPRTVEMDSRYQNPDGDAEGPWTMADPFAPGGTSHQGMVFGVQHPVTGNLVYPRKNSHWVFGQDRLLSILGGWGRYEKAEPTVESLHLRADLLGIHVDQLRPNVMDLVIPHWSSIDQDFALAVVERGPWPRYVLTRGGHGGFRLKRHMRDVGGKAPYTLFSNVEVGHTDEAKKEIGRLFPKTAVFSTPKPERLLERIIHIGSNPGDVVLDVFAGSGTTAAVAQKTGRRWVTCELLESTFKQFTRPRLEKVVNDQDPGGITQTKGERIAGTDVDLPDGVSADDAAKFTSVLNKLISDDPDLKKSTDVKALKAMSKTQRTKQVLNWRGGGGFQVAHLSPACFDYDETLDRVLLTEAAHGQLLVESVAANLGFKLLDVDDDYIFDGQRGKALLKVVDGLATTDLVDSLVAEVQPGETIVLAATTVIDGVRQYLRKACKGSRVIAIPDEIFSYSKGVQA